MVDIPSDWKILGVLLSSIEDPKIVENIDLRQTEVNLGDKVFRLIPEGLPSGFYDWMRTTNGEVIGVRVAYPSHDGMSYLASRKNVEVGSTATTKPKICIYFGSERVFDEGKSQDQDFGGNDLFNSDGNAIIITFIAPRESIKGRSKRSVSE